MSDIVSRTQITSHDRNGHAPRELASPGQVSALSLWKAFRHRWAWALCAGLVLAAGAGISAFLANPARYNATALIRVLSSQQRVIEQQQLVETDKSPFQRAQPSIAVSRKVLRLATQTDRGRAIATTGKYGDLTSWLERYLKVGFLEDTDIMQVTLSGPDSTETADLLNLVVEAYAEEAHRADNLQLAEKIEAVNKIVLRQQEKLREEKDKLAALAKTLRTVDPAALSQKLKALQDEYSSLRKEIALLQAQLRELEVKKVSYKAMAESPTAEAPAFLVEQHVEADLGVIKQAAEVRNREELLERTVKTSLPGSAAIAKVEDDVKKAKARLEVLRGEARQRAGELFKKKSQGEAAAFLKQAEEETRIRAGQFKELGLMEEKLKQEIERLGTTSFELEAKRAEIDIADSTLKLVREQRDRLQVEQLSSARRIHVQQLAEPPDSKNTRTQYMLTALAAAAGLFIGIVGACLLEVRARRIQSADEVTGELGMNVVGTLPALPNQWATKAGGGDGYWGHLVTESVAYIRTVVLSARPGTPMQVLMITSAQSQEGKTMLACNLALSIARTGRRTLLIDGDLRRPSVAPLFGVPEGPGISELLRHEADVPACIQPTAMPGLSVLPAGRCSRDVIQALTQGGIEILFRQLRAEYDFIVVDSCPVLPVSDALLLGRLVDTVVLCVRPRVSRAPAVYAAHEMLNRLNIPVLGTVINGGARHDKRTDYLYLLGENTAAALPSAADA